MANSKVQLANGTVLIDITDTTATASDVASGKYFYSAAGVKTLGTSSGGSSDTYQIILEQDAQGYLLLDDTATILNASGVSF